MQLIPLLDIDGHQIFQIIVNSLIHWLEFFDRPFLRFLAAGFICRGSDFNQFIGKFPISIQIGKDLIVRISSGFCPHALFDFCKVCIK